MQAAHPLSYEIQPYQNLKTYRDADGEALWFAMNVRPRPCFTQGVIEDLLDFQESFKTIVTRGNTRPLCLVFASESPGIFSLGGDLSLFQSAIEQRDHALMSSYALSCVKVLHNHLHTPQTVTISLLEGDALGAGLESALASDIVVAERGIRAGFPEVLFNLVPGHGAYFFVARRIGAQAADKMIRSGAVYSAEELHAMGLIDILADKGQGRQAIRELLAQHKRSWNAFEALQLIKRHYLPVSYEMLAASAQIWVDAAMRLTSRNLRMMERLVSAQKKRVDATDPAEACSSMAALTPHLSGTEPVRAMVGALM